MVYAALATRGSAPLQQLADEVERLLLPTTSWISRMSPVRWLSRRRVFSWLLRAGADPKSMDLETLRDAMKLELAMREDRAGLKQWQEALGENLSGKSESLPDLRFLVRRLREKLCPVIEASRRIRACPVQRATYEMQQGCDARGYGSVLDACRASLAMWPYPAIAKRDWRRCGSGLIPTGSPRAWERSRAACLDPIL